jgi:hypothetical protein
MADIKHYARAAADPHVIAEVAQQLAATWDPAGEFRAPDGERTALSHARTIVGILGTGQNEAAVMGYLRFAEEAALGEARSTGQQRSAIAKAAWRVMSRAAIRSATRRESPT